MSLKDIVKEVAEKNPIGFKKELDKELKIRAKKAIDAKCTKMSE